MANMNSTGGEAKRRVKLYALNDSRQWEDKGTGHIYWICDINEQHYVSLLVKSEVDGSTLLDSKILLSTNYQKQQDTLIVWSDADKRDLALSFQERAGCDEIWEKICEVIGKDSSLLSLGPSGGSGNGDNMGESDEDQLDNDSTNTSSYGVLPPCELGRLKEIRDFFVVELMQKSNAYKEKLAALIETKNYIKKLVDLFHVSEDLENTEGLNHLFEIFRAIFYLNKSSLFDILLSDDLIMEVIGCLEYDPSKPEPIRHREYISTKAQFKEVIPFDNGDLVNKIHQTYRIQYIQDVIFPAPSVFEENSLASLTSFIFLNKVEISNRIQEDERFLNELFENLKNPDLDTQKRRDMFQFLKEYISFSHSLQQTRELLYQSLYNHGILSVIEVALTIDDEKVNSIAIEIFSQFVEVAPTLVREFILKELDPKNLQPKSALLHHAKHQHQTTPSTPVPPFSSTSTSSSSLSVAPASTSSAAATFQTPISAGKDELSTSKKLALGEAGGPVPLSTILNIDQDFEPVLINYVIKRMINDPDEELSGAMQIANLFKLLIDPENMLSVANAEKSEFLQCFYKKTMPVLLTPLMSNTAKCTIIRDDYRLAQLENLILDFLSFCVEHHTYHIKIYIIYKDLLKRILVLLKSKHQFLALSALRFLRKTISLKEDCYFKHIIKANLLAPVVDALKTNGSRYNILNSAIIELFDFIRSEDIKSLMTYVIESFYKDLENLNYVKTFKDLKLRYEQLKEKQNDSINRSRLSSEGTPALYRTRSSDRYKQQTTDMSDYIKDSDAWFEEEDDEEYDSRYDGSNPANCVAGSSSSSSSSSNSNSSSNGSNGNNNTNSNDDQSDNNTPESMSENNLENFLEYKKSNTMLLDDNEDTIFSPVKSSSVSYTSSSSSSSSATTTNTTTTSSTSSSTSTTNANSSTSTTTHTAFKSINIKISNSTTVLLNNNSNVKTAKSNANNSPGSEQQQSPTGGSGGAYYDNENMISSPSSYHSNSSTPTHSPSASKKQTLVDYEYDSDEENDENEERIERLNSKDEDEENIEPPSAKRLAMSNSPVAASSTADYSSDTKENKYDSGVKSVTSSSNAKSAESKNGGKWQDQHAESENKNEVTSSSCSSVPTSLSAESSAESSNCTNCVALKSENEETTSSTSKEAMSEVTSTADDLGSSTSGSGGDGDEYKATASERVNMNTNSSRRSTEENGEIQSNDASTRENDMGDETTTSKVHVQFNRHHHHHHHHHHNHHQSTSSNESASLALNNHHHNDGNGQAASSLTNNHHHHHHHQNNINENNIESLNSGTAAVESKLTASELKLSRQHKHHEQPPEDASSSSSSSAGTVTSKLRKEDDHQAENDDDDERVSSSPSSSPGSLLGVIEPANKRARLSNS